MKSGQEEWQARFWENGNVDDLREPSKGKSQKSRYAVWIDLDPEKLAEIFFEETGRSGYQDVGRELSKLGLTLQRGGIYFGDHTVNAVRCILAIQRLNSKFNWFAASVRNAQMFRIEEVSDLKAAIDLVDVTKKVATQNG
jgi:virulence-associated protein VapD